jgi:hypothetical protein
MRPPASMMCYHTPTSAYYTLVCCIVADDVLLYVQLCVQLILMLSNFVECCSMHVCSTLCELQPPTSFVDIVCFII